MGPTVRDACSCWVLLSSTAHDTGARGYLLRPWVGILFNCESAKQDWKMSAEPPLSEKVRSERRTCEISIRLGAPKKKLNDRRGGGRLGDKKKKKCNVCGSGINRWHVRHAVGCCFSASGARFPELLGRTVGGEKKKLLLLLLLLRFLSARVPHTKQVKFSPRPAMLPGFYCCFDELEPPALLLRFGVPHATVALPQCLCRYGGKAKNELSTRFGPCVPYNCHTIGSVNCIPIGRMLGQQQHYGNTDSH